MKNIFNTGNMSPVFCFEISKLPRQGVHYAPLYKTVQSCLTAFSVNMYKVYSMFICLFVFIKEWM